MRDRLRDLVRLARYRLACLPERGQMWAARHVPRWLAYRCTIRVMAHATTGPYGATDPTVAPMMDALTRWEGPPHARP